MNSKQRRNEIECLKRYQEKLGLNVLIEFLHDEKLTTEESFKDLSRSHEYPERIQFILNEALESEKIALLAYEWTILPVERIRLTITTERQHKEFSYDSPNV